MGSCLTMTDRQTNRETQSEIEAGTETGVQAQGETITEHVD